MTIKDKMRDAARLDNQCGRREGIAEPHSHEDQSIETMKKYIYAIMTIFCVSCISIGSAQTPEKAEDICPLLIGEKLPTATLQDADGRKVLFKNVIEGNHTVLVFYRGGWCPYCNLQLSGLMQIEKDILDLGYRIVDISPDDFQNLKTTGEKDSINYKLLSDPGGKLIQDIGIAFQTSIVMEGYIATKGQKGKTPDVIPVPTVMVLDGDGVILFEYINPNYKIRITGEMLPAVLEVLKKWDKLKNLIIQPERHHWDGQSVEEYKGQKDNWSGVLTTKATVYTMNNRNVITLKCFSSPNLYEIREEFSLKAELMLRPD